MSKTKELDKKEIIPINTDVSTVEEFNGKEPDKSDYVNIHLFTILLSASLEIFEYSATSLWKSMKFIKNDKYKSIIGRKNKRNFVKAEEKKLKELAKALKSFSKQSWQIFNSIEGPDIGEKRSFITTYIFDKIFDNITNWYVEAEKKYEEKKNQSSE